MKRPHWFRPAAVFAGGARVPRKEVRVGRVRMCPLLASIALLVTAATAGAAFPPPQKYVLDQAGVIGSSEAAELQALLRDVERQTTAEIAVVTVTSLDGMSVEEYGNGLFKAWGIGKKGADNGILVLVCPPEKTMRIEVGYGLEPILPDGLAGSVIRSEFTPAFRNGDYGGGILAGVRRVASIVRDNHVLSPDERRTLENASRPTDYRATLFVTLFVTVGSLVFGVGLRRKTVFLLLWGAGFGGVPFALTLAQVIHASPWLLGSIGAVALAGGFTLARRSKGTAAPRGVSSGIDSSPAWTFGGGSSASDGGGSSSSDSDSFGGGESGGGGASGSW